MTPGTSPAYEPPVPSPTGAPREPAAAVPDGAGKAGPVDAPGADARMAPAAVARPSVELHIDEIVLNGFPPGDGAAIGDAVTRELIRLLEEGSLGGPLLCGGEVDRLEADAFRVKPGCGPAAVGAALARALYGRLSR